jgi:serine/threonine protein kinase
MSIVLSGTLRGEYLRQRARLSGHSKKREKSKYFMDLCLFFCRASLANGGFDQHQFKEVSPSAIDCISQLLTLEPTKRLTTTQCLEHNWLTTVYLDTIKTLETQLIRKYLARRRWQRWFNAIRAMNRMKSFAGQGTSSSDGTSSPSPIVEPEDNETDIGLPEFTSSSLSGRWV